MKLFKSYIQNVASLHSIGYAFGDSHINNVIREWLEVSPERKLIVVGPKPSIPSEVLHLAPQIVTVESSATSYLERFSPTKLTPSELQQCEERAIEREAKRSQEGFA